MKLFSVKGNSDEQLDSVTSSDSSILITAITQETYNPLNGCTKVHAISLQQHLVSMPPALL